MTFFKASLIDDYDIESGTRLAVVPMAYEPDNYFVLDGETAVEDVEEWIRENESVAFTVTIDEIK